MSGRIEDDVAYFDVAETNPPTPFRVAEIEFARVSIYKLWPASEAADKELKAESQALSIRSGKRRGPAPIILETTVKKMTDEIESGALSRERLGTMKEEEMKVRWRVDYVAAIEVVRNFDKLRQIATIDK
jgi:hypothetical protein